MVPGPARRGTVAVNFTSSFDSAVSPGLVEESAGDVWFGVDDGFGVVDSVVPGDAVVDFVTGGGVVAGLFTEVGVDIVGFDTAGGALLVAPCLATPPLKFAESNALELGLAMLGVLARNVSAGRVMVDDLVVAGGVTEVAGACPKAIEVFSANLI